VIKDPRFIEMVELIHSKKESNLYTPESEWKAWKDQSFASKKQGSLWMTFLIERIEKRINR
jgi:hypothetical protein